MGFLWNHRNRRQSEPVSTSDCSLARSKGVEYWLLAALCWIVTLLVVVLCCVEVYSFNVGLWTEPNNSTVRYGQTDKRRDLRIGNGDKK